METLKKRQTAFILAAVVVVFSIWFGAQRSLGQQVAITTDQFYEGVYDSAQARTLSSIYSQLDQRVNTAMSMITISGGLADSETDALRQAREGLLEGLRDGLGPSELYRLNLALEEATDAYVKALTPLLDEDDLALLETDYNKMKNAARVIEDSGYNDAVREFDRSVLSVFPTNLLIRITTVDPPELFA